MPGRSILSLYIMLVLVACHNPSDDATDKFKRVDSSLRASNHAIVLKDSLIILYLAIESVKNADARLQASADTVYDKFKAAMQLIDSIQQALRRQDTEGENIDLPGKLLIGTSTGLALKTRLAGFYNCARANLSEINLANTADSLFLCGAPKPNNDYFIQAYFSKIPTVGAITILFKFHNDCENLCMYTLNSIKRRLVK